MHRFAVLLLTLCVFTLPARAAEPGSGPPEAGDPAADVGSFIDLEKDRQLQLFLEDHQVIACFVDPDGLIMESPADSILLIIDDPDHRKDEWRAVLKPVDDVRLTSPRRFYGPDTFRARIIIRFTEGEPASFSHVPLELERNLENPA